MISIEEFYQDQLSKTSPVHKPAYDVDFSYQLSLQSPLSAPANAFERAQVNERYADIKDPLVFGDAIASYEKIMKNEAKNKNTPLKLKPKKKQHVFKPFTSFEATELTVHQLRSVFSKAANRKIVQ